MSLKSKLGFIYRGILGIKDTLFDRPTISMKISHFSIGSTINGEDIRCYKFGEGDEKILYFGGIHGNEVGTVKLMNRWINYLLENAPESTTVYVIPCLNVDGYKIACEKPDFFAGGTIGKTNYNQVDLNRNFPTSNWSPKSKIFIAGKYSEVSAGTSPASEPEIASILRFIEQESISTVYTFHNCWSTVFSLTSSKKFEQYSKFSGYRKYTIAEWEKLDANHKQGNMNVWGVENNINVIEVETKSRWGSDWRQNKLALIESIK